MAIHLGLISRTDARFWRGCSAVAGVLIALTGCAVNPAGDSYLFTVIGLVWYSLASAALNVLTTIPADIGARAAMLTGRILAHETNRSTGTRRIGFGWLLVSHDTQSGQPDIVPSGFQ